MKLISSVLVLITITASSLTGASGSIKNSPEAPLLSPEKDSSFRKSELITSGNPIIKHIRSADPSAEVWNDGQVWIYASHDHDDAVDYSTMDRYHAYSSYDMVNWKDHGEILHARDVSWGNPNNGFMFAPDAAYKDGVYYLYFPTLSSDWKWRVGVATSSKPEGPFTDIGRYIDGPDHIDPTCFMDDDGQAYLIWGGDAQNPKIARLKENMTELDEEPKVIDFGFNNFGEGGYMHKKDSIYYFSYTCNTCYPFQGYYSMGDNPYGPFEYKGEVNRMPPGAQDHHSIIEFHGQWYYFYHVGNYGTDGSAFRRNVCVDSLFYNSDGTMQLVKMTTTGVGQDLIGGTPGIIVPGRIEAEAFFRNSGISTINVGDTATLATGIDNEDWMEYVLQILGKEEYTLEVKVANVLSESKIYLLVDDLLSDSIFVNPGDELILLPLLLNKGKHKLKLLFSNEINAINMMDIDWLNVAGEIHYYSIEASSSAGGIIEPGGTNYYAEGESVSFTIRPEENYILDSMVIDGISHAASESYTFNNIQMNHSIAVWFSKCNSLISHAYYQVNGVTETATSDTTHINLTELDQLKLEIICEDACTITWDLPGGAVSTDSEITIDSIRTNQAGEYAANLINDQGCGTTYTFLVSVENIELDVWQAEDYFSQSGTQLQPCTDIGGGWHVGFIENNDWTYYSIDIEEPGYYAITARAATALEGGQIAFSIRDSMIASIPVYGELSDGWQDWYTTEPVVAGIKEGLQRIKLTFKGDEGLLFNLNWFNLTYSGPFEQDTAENSSITMNVYPNPVQVTNSTIKYTLTESSIVDLGVYTLNGKLISIIEKQAHKDPGVYTLEWNVTDSYRNALSEGVYIIRLQYNESVVVKKVVVN